MRLIDVDELKKRATKVMFPDAPECGEFDAVAVDDIDCMPTIDPETLRPTAHWVFGSTMGHSWMKCSRCLVSQDGQTAVFGYCPNCGARMVNADD